jgi:hypothetical protein
MRCNKNQPSNLGSSETTREAPQSIQLIIYDKLGKPDHIQNIDKYFLQWFVGFSEGDGSFEQSKKAFIINKKDPKLLFRIKNKLGFGSVYQTTNCSIWRYSVTGQTNCLRLYYLFNGNLTLQKTIDKFQKWAIRLAPKTSVQKIKLIVRLDNGWLAGFIEAEGGFYGRVRKKSQMKLGYQFQKKFYLTQKGEQDVLHQILFLLKSNTKIYTFEQNNKTYSRIDISSFDSHELLLNYLSRFPIFGIKNVSICIWRKMHGRQDRNEHLTAIGLKKIRNLCHLLKKNNQRCYQFEVEDIVHNISP